MRYVIGGLMMASLLAFVRPAAADDGFMKECLATIERKTCDCMLARIPVNQRTAATAGLRKSNEAMAPGGNLLDPSTLPPYEMQGLNAVVLAQSYCM